MVQIGTEGGFLPAPVVLPNTPIGYDMDKRSITVGNMLEHTLLLGPPSAPMLSSTSRRCPTASS